MRHHRRGRGLFPLPSTPLPTSAASLQIPTLDDAATGSIVRLVWGAAPRCPSSCRVSYSSVLYTTLVQWQARVQCTSPHAGMSSVEAPGRSPASPGGSTVGGGEARRAEVYEAGEADAHVLVHVGEDGRPPAGKHGDTSSRRTAGTGAGAAHSTEAQQALPTPGSSRGYDALAQATVRIV
jgi:hypothetical protein